MREWRVWRKRIVSAAVLGCAGILLTVNTALAFTNLQKNSRGPEVLQVQKCLKALGYSIPELDGVFGNSTYRAVMAFQRSNKIKITGVVDKKTYNALQVARRNFELNGGLERETAGAGRADDGDSWQDMKGSAVNVPESQPFLLRDNVPNVIRTAKKYIGVPYKFGGDTPKAFDCSGYLQYVFARHGMNLPRTADLQFKLGRSVPASRLEAGDLVFFSTYEPGASHCGIYLGNGEFIHASSSKGVRVDKLNDDYWKAKYYGGKHIVK